MAKESISRNTWILAGATVLAAVITGGVMIMTSSSSEDSGPVAEEPATDAGTREPEPASEPGDALEPMDYVSSGQSFELALNQSELLTPDRVPLAVTGQPSLSAVYVTTGGETAHLELGDSIPLAGTSCAVTLVEVTSGAAHTFSLLCD